MSSQPTGDTPGSAVSASQAEGTAAAPPTVETAAAAAPAGTPGAAGSTATAAASGAPETTETDDRSVCGHSGDAPADATTTTADSAIADPGTATMVLDPEPSPAKLDYDLEYDRQPVSKLAVLALVTSVLALVPIAVACAVGALAAIRRSGRRGHGMAMAALFLCAAWVIMGSAVGTVAVLTHGFKKPVTIKYHESAVFKLQEGDCVNTPGGQLVTVLPCSSPHDAEVFATLTLPASAWRGTAAVRQEASSACASRLAGYINPQLAISLAQSYVFPNEAAWAAGTRTVICEVRAVSGQLTGSVRGATTLTGP